MTTSCIHPLVSSIVPMYNSPLPYIREAVDSIAAQTYPNQEIILVDDGSTNDSPVSVASWENVRLISQLNKGDGAARNYGIREAGGEFLAFLDSDDVWAPSKIEKQMKFLLDDPALGFVLCRVEVFYEGDSADKPWATEKAKTEKHGAFFPSALLARRQVFEQIGFFDEKYHIGADPDWFLRAQDAGIRHKIVEEPLLKRRIHGSNLSSRQTELRSVVFDSVFASIRRKKAQQAKE